MADLPLTFTIDGKDYKASWSGQGQPSQKDLEEIEGLIRQRYGLTVPKAASAGAMVGLGAGPQAKRPPMNAAQVLGGTHVGSKPIAKPVPAKPQPNTLPQIVKAMPEVARQNQEIKAKQEAQYYQENFPPVGRETGPGNEAQIAQEIHQKGVASLSDPYKKVTEAVGRPLQEAIGKHIRNISFGTSPISRLMDVLMPGSSQEAKDEAVGTWIGVPDNVDQAAIMAAIPVGGKAAGFGMKWLDDLVKVAETKADAAIKALGASDVIEQLAPKSDLPIFIPKEDPNYPAGMQGVDPLGLAKLGEKPVPPPKVPQAPKPAPAKGGGDDFEKSPLIRVIGEDFDSEFLHGTRKANIKTLGGVPPSGAKRRATGNPLLDAIAPPTQNEFGADILLSELRQPHQALMFGSGKGESVARVSLKTGTRLLDLSDEIARAPKIAFGSEPSIVRVFRRPAIMDDFLKWYEEKISEGYKTRNPEWRTTQLPTIDTSSSKFDPSNFAAKLGEYARDRGYDGIRLADETILLNRNAIANAREATESELNQLRNVRTYPGSKSSSLFTDQPTGAYAEALAARTPKPASTKPVAPKRVSAAPPKPTVEAPKPASKIKTALEGASQERQSAYEAMIAAQKRQTEALKTPKSPTKKAGGVKGRQILPEEVEYFKAWVKEKGWQAASSVEDFVKHMVELGDEAVHWRRIATANAPIKREGQAAQNASTSAFRAKVGLEAFPNVDKQTMAGWMSDAKAKGYNTREGASKLVKMHAIGERPTFNAPETVGLASRLDELDKQYNRAKSVLDSAIGTSREGEAFAKSQTISDEIDQITNALNKAGTQQGRDFVARRAMVKDRSFVGLYSELRKAADRPLTQKETEGLQNLAKEFKQTDEKAAAHAKKLATEKASELDRIARGELSAVFQKRKRTPITDAEFKVRSRAIASEAARVFQSHMGKMRTLGGDIAPEIAALAKELAPHIKAYSQLVFDHGITKVQDNLSEVARFLKANKIEGIEENEVAAVITGRLKQQSEKPAMTAWESFTQEVNTLFKSGKSELDNQRRFIEAKAKEAKKLARDEMRQADQAKIREEYDQVLAEEKARKEYEKAFWQEVRWWQAGFDEQKMRAARLDREEAKKRWMASAAGRRAQILNRIDTLEKRMEVFKQSGIITGQKSKLIPPVDPLAREITIKETALKNRWHKIVNDAKMEAEAAKLKEVSGPVEYWLRAAYSGHRELIATFDDSFPFNQGGLALFSDPGSWAKGFKKSLQSFSDKGYTAVQDDIAQHPRFMQAEAANLFEGGLEDVFGKGRISQQPWFKSFEQAYEGGGAALRLDLFDRWATMMESSGRPLDVNDLEKLADEVKTWTGLGNWGKNQKGLGKAFFALRYRLSQLELLTGQPLFRSMNHWRQTGNPALMKVMLRRYARGMGTMALTVSAANKALEEWGPKDTRIELDSTATNFGRLIVGGRATIQILPPVTRLYLLASRMKGGQYVTEAGIRGDTSDFGDRSRRDLFVDYTASGLHPWFSYLWKYINAADTEDKKFFDEAFDGSVEQYEDAAKQFLPISAQQSLQLAFDSDMTPAEKILGAMLNFFVPVSPIREPQGGKKKKVSAPGGPPSTKRKLPGSIPK